MILRSLSAPLNSIHGIGSGASSKLSKLAIQSVSDLLLHYPRDWEDRVKTVLLKMFNNAKVCTVVKVLAREWIGFGKMKTLKIYIEDESAQGALLCFNRPWMDKQIVNSQKYFIYGRFFYKYGEIQSSSFEMEPVIDGKALFGKILPVYPLTAGLTQAMLRRFIAKALKKYKDSFENEIPDNIIKRENFLSKNEAISEIHFPSSYENLEKAKKTLIYEELFNLEIMIAKRLIERKKRKQKNKSNEDKKNVCLSNLQQRLIERLPFKLTKGQYEAIFEIMSDMGSGIPMARLLQGDVGSGKTLVAFLACLNAVENGGQAVIMAPTELLARQHAENAARIFEPLGISVAFLTGNIKAQGRKELIKNLASGNINITVGTHALFSKDVEYKNLKLAVIDEQHRFGVTQRSMIMQKGEDADLLMMSATPIPRTLALTVFGDMDVYVIKDMPEGRKPVKTHLAKESNEKKVYDFVRSELEQGRQAYFVYPLIEEGNDIKDAVSMTERLSNEIFPNYKTSLIHSKLPEDEKKDVMDNFRKGNIHILAATSVVEVGVDVPNAACMVIEHAERFGLSALHQLRGRVGRGAQQSYCFLLYSDELTDDGKARLKVMIENTDGFVIAEEDLKMRGPGQIIGTEQSGFLAMGIADPIRDIKILEQARNDVFEMLEKENSI